MTVKDVRAECSTPILKLPNLIRRLSKISPNQGAEEDQTAVESTAIITPEAVERPLKSRRLVDGAASA